MITKTQNRKLLLWGDGAMTMNTSGELIRTVKIDTTYWLWGIPIWKSIKYINRTLSELSFGRVFD